MKRLLLICGLLLWFAYQAKPAGSIGTPDKPHQAPSLKNDESPRQQNGCQTVVLQESFNGVPSEEKHQPQTQNAPGNPHNWIDRVNAFSTLVIAVFTVLLFFAVKWQTGTTRDTERAWVIATPVDNAPVIGFIPAA